MKELNLKLCRWLFWYNLFTHVKTNMKTNSPDFVFSPQETSRFLSTNSHDRGRENYFSQTDSGSAQRNSSWLVPQGFRT